MYIGVTNEIAKRIHEHKTSLVAGFTSKYHVNLLVHIETFNDIRDAIFREKCLKKWNRAWKLKLIEKTNPDWTDLAGSPLEVYPPTGGRG